ncbi:ribosome-inactivating family protein [Streptomyces sp. NPDC059564]|uniref:ribosome-inactivating family protein n=1 Tax=Streptomyces sp. NPDC059564 TaxID=3346865 RepID=UPI0036BCC116
MRKPLTMALLCLPMLGVALPPAQAAESPQTASAAAARVTVRDVEWNVNSENPDTLRSEYSRMIWNLRRATGEPLPGRSDWSVLQTRASTDIIAVNAVLPDDVRLTLYLTANNLYLRGFSTGNAGNVVQFNDFNLGSALGRNATTLTYSSHYGGGGLGYSDPNSRRLWITQHGFVQHMRNLANYARRPGGEIHADLLTAIGAVAEAARFRNIENRVRSGIGGADTVSEQEAAEENDWGQVSNYMYRANGTSNPGTFDLGGLPLHDFNEGSRYVALLLNPAGKGM